MATIPLDTKRRGALGLPPIGTTVVVSELPSLSSAQWSDPEAVAARFLLVLTTYNADNDPALVAGQRGVYATPRLAADLARAGSGAAALAVLRAQGADFHGEVVGLATARRSHGTATVAASVRHTTSFTEGPAPRPRVAFYVLRLVLDHRTGRWLVADVEVG